MTGTVTSFDGARGLGEVGPDPSDDAATTLRYRFHCTQIGDGSRTIAVGTRVVFTIIPGLLGAWEAGAVTPT